MHEFMKISTCICSMRITCSRYVLVLLDFFSSSESHARPDRAVRALMEKAQALW